MILVREAIERMEELLNDYGHPWSGADHVTVDLAYQALRRFEVSAEGGVPVQ